MDVGPDPRLVAGLYSQLAGVLAGFALAGVIALVAAQLTSSRPAAHAARSGPPLVAAVAALVISSVNFAILAGEVPGGVRAAVLQILASTGMCVACVTLFFALLVLLHGVELDAPESAAHRVATSTFVRNLLLFLVSPVAVLLMWNSLHDHVNLTRGGAAGFSGLDAFAAASLLTTVATSIVVYTGRLRHPLWRRLRWLTTVTGAAATLSGLSVLAVSIAIIFVRETRTVPDVLPRRPWQPSSCSCSWSWWRPGRRGCRSRARHRGGPRQDGPAGG